MQGYKALVSENIEELMSHLLADSTTVFNNNNNNICMRKGREKYHII